MKNPYIILTNSDTDETTIINRLKFSKFDKLQDFLNENKNCKVQMVFV